MNYYLLGYPVSHSVSPDMHNTAFRELGLHHHYNTYEVPPGKLGDIIENLKGDEFGGANVTIPHKINVIQYLDELAVSAKRTGAVNTIEYSDEILIGHNTDSTGGVNALTETYGDLSSTKVVLLGAGGAARALATELASRVDELIILNRSLEKAKKLVDLVGGTSYDSIKNQETIKTANILINATPVGMHPNINDTPVQSTNLHKGLLVFDIVYNPLRTRLMMEAERKGAETLGGLWMLVYQGVEAFSIWTGLEPSPGPMYKAALSALETSQ
jgi:shikimate dehydrogenase